MDNALRDLRLRLAVLNRRRAEGVLSVTESVELEILARQLNEWEAGYRPVAVA